MFKLSHHSSQLGRCIQRSLCGFALATFMFPAIGAEQALSAQTTVDARLEKLYQQMLFAYYQDDLDGALLQYSLLEHYYPDGLQQLPAQLYQDANEPELLKGSISLAYGLEDQAAEIFQRLLGSYAVPEKRSAAWFGLGLTYYQQGQWLNASQAFSHIDKQDALSKLDSDTQDQLIYVRVQLANEHALGQQTEDWAQQLSEDSIYHYYLLYNQALANLQLGNTEQAISQLKQLVTPPEQGFQDFLPSLLEPYSDDVNEAESDAKQQEILAIQDRANLTLAYTLLQQGKSHQAYEVFARIRRQGLDGDAALLGYGWAAAKDDELQSALGIWQSLMALPEHSEYSLEAYLASAYIYEKGFAPGQSVATLQAGLQRFKQVLAELSQASQTVQQAPFVQALAQDFERAQPSAELPASSDNQPLLAALVHNSGTDTIFRNQLAALQQSQNIAKQLQDWQQRLAYYSLMLDERQEQRVQRAQKMLQARIFTQLADLQKQRDNLAAQLAIAQQQQDGISLMPVAYQQSLARLNTAQQRLSTINQRLSAINQQKNALQQPLLKAEYQQRLRRLQGILSWQASEAFAGNNRQAQKALKQLDDEIVNTAEQQSRLLTMLAQRPDFAVQRQRVAQLVTRIEDKLAINQELQQQLVAQLSQYLAQNISQFKSKVDDYVVQAQLALVRLNDQALQQNQNDAEPKPADIGRPPALEPQTRQQP